MNDNQIIEIANHLIEARKETWSEDLESKAISEVKNRPDMHSTWQQKFKFVRSEKTAIFNQTQLPKNPIMKISAGLANPSLKNTIVPETTNCTLTSYQQGSAIAKISQALQQNNL